MWGRKRMYHKSTYTGQFNDVISKITTPTGKEGPGNKWVVILKAITGTNFLNKCYIRCMWYDHTLSGNWPNDGEWSYERALPVTLTPEISQLKASQASRKQSHFGRRRMLHLPGLEPVSPIGSCGQRDTTVRMHKRVRPGLKLNLV